MSYGLGIDLGTSFTRAAISGGGQTRMVPLGGGSILMPSVVRVEADGTLIAGEPDVGNDDPFRTARDFKRRLGNPTPLILGGQPHSAVSLLAATLKSVIETITTAEGGPPDRVVLTQPAIWDPHRREQFAELPNRADIDPSIVTVITEPEAAANYYASRGHLSNGDVVAVHDLGGGTFNTSVGRMTSNGIEILGAPEEIETVGGGTFDDLILGHVDQVVDGAFSALDPRDLAAAIALQHLRTECIRAKERLSRDDATNIPVLLPDRHIQVRLTRTEFEGLISNALEASLTTLHRALHSASIEPGDLAGVLLVGGSSRIPLVARRLSADLGRPVMTDPHPQHCVALGAGAIAGRGLTGTMTTDLRPVPRPRQHGRRRMLIAATTVTVLLAAGAGAYAARDLSLSSDDEKQVAAVPLSSPRATETTTATAASPTETMASPSPSPTPKPKSTRKAKAVKKKATPTRSPTPPKPKSQPLPISGAILGLEAVCLDVVNARTENGTPIQTTTCNGSGAQIWTLRTDHTFRVLGKCMDVGSATDGGRPPAQLQDCSGAASQKWRLTGGKIINSKSKLCLDIVGNSTEDRIPSVLNPCQADAGQKWKMAADAVLDSTG